MARPADAPPAPPPRRRLPALRLSAFVVVLAVVLAPLLFVWGAGLFDHSDAEQMRANVTAAADEAADTIAARRGELDAATGEALAAIARARAVRVRVVTASGEPAVDRDRDVRGSAVFRARSPFFGGRTPTLEAFERTLPPLGARRELREAREHGRYAGCELPFGGQLLVCQAARAVAGPDGAAAVVLAQQSTPRAIRALADVRLPLAKLTLFVLATGVVLSAWLARRIVRPIEQLRAQVLARANAPRAAAPIGTSGRDEFDDLAGAFNELLAALAERRRANEAFVADLAHELKNPVAAVRACAEALEGDAPAPLDPARAARLGRVLRESSARLDALVSRFLELARAEAGLPDEPRSPVDLAALARALLDALARDERHRGVRFELARLEPPGARIGSPGAFTVTAAPERIETALRNVLENAASFAGAGGAVRVALAREADGAVTIAVSDSGPGIAPEHLPRVFDRFFTTRGSQQGGTGLGLALARAVVEAHGGTITASSPGAGRGATFTLRLPG